MEQIYNIYENYGSLQQVSMKFIKFGIKLQEDLL